MGTTLKILVKEFRKVMEPNTAIHLKEKKKNTLKDFVHVSGPIGVTHFFIFSSTDVGSYLKIGTVPHGPTLTFRILEYSLCKDVKALQTNPISPSFEFMTDPIIVLSGFSNDEEDRKYNLTKTCLKEAFPSVNVNSTKIENCKRVVLFKFDKETERIHFRHYLVTTKTYGVTPKVKTLFKGKNLEELGKYKDISEFILESEKEDNDELEEIENTISLDQENNTTQKVIRLVELGPRMDLLLIKIEEKLCSGIVWYHRYVKKTPEELEKQQKIVEQRRILKEKRRKEQLENVQKKKKVSFQDEIQQTGQSVQDNIEWYKREVGQEPDEEEKQYLNTIETDKPVKYNPVYRKKKKEKRFK